MAREDLDNLTQLEKDELLRWFLHHMGMERRGQFMSERPIVYTKLYPTAKEAVVDHVRIAVAAVHS